MIWQPNGTTGYVNISQQERRFSLIGGALLLALDLSRRSLPGLIVALIGGLLGYRGLTGHSQFYDSLGISTAIPTQQPAEPALTEADVFAENRAAYPI